eukprot:2152038-Rhodomonas_salina.1
MGMRGREGYMKIFTELGSCDELGGSCFGRYQPTSPFDASGAQKTSARLSDPRSREERSRAGGSGGRQSSYGGHSVLTGQPHTRSGASLPHQVSLLHRIIGSPGTILPPARRNSCHTFTPEECITTRPVSLQILRSRIFYQVSAATISGLYHSAHRGWRKQRNALYRCALPQVGSYATAPTALGA